MSVVWDIDSAARPDRLHTFAREERDAAAVPIPNQHEHGQTRGCTDRSILRRFHLKDFPPYDRALTNAELQKLLVLPQADVPHAGIFSANGDWDAEKTWRAFKVWKRRKYVMPKRTKTSLLLFLRTRAKVVPSSTTTQQVYDLCEQVLSDEAQSNSAVRLFFTPYDDGLAEKQRRQALIEARILTSVNAPSQVAPPYPRFTDPGWEMLKVDELRGITFPDVLVEWVSIFQKDFSVLMKKAQGCWSSGKAYAIKYQRKGEYLFVYARCGQSFCNTSSKAYNVIVCFQQDQRAVTRIVWAKCFECAGGENCPCCHHIVALNIGLMQFAMGIIRVGQYNGGDRAWGQGRLLMDMPSLTSLDIALLFPGQHALRIFPGNECMFVCMHACIF